MARQGFAFLTSEPARVVYPPKDGEPLDAELKDVPADGKTVGEIVMRGNIAMKEVCGYIFMCCELGDLPCWVSSTSKTLPRLPRLSAEDTLVLGILRLCTKTLLWKVNRG